MKTRSFNSILFILFFTFVTVLHSQNNAMADADSLVCLRIEGKIMRHGKRSPCLVELYRSGMCVDSMRLPSRIKRFGFELNLRSSYTIRLSSAGYVSKLICITTDSAPSSQGIYRFKFTTVLMDTCQGKKLNPDALDFPVALIYFDTKAQNFDYAREYTRRIKQEWLRKEPKDLHLATNHP